MKKSLCLLIAAALVFSHLLLSTATRAQDRPDDPEAELMAWVNHAWNTLASWRAEFEQLTGVNLGYETAFDDFSRAFPETTAYVLERMLQRNGAKVPKSKGRKASVQASGWFDAWGLPKSFGPLPLFWFAMQMNQVADDAIEYIIILELTKRHVSEATAKKIANHLTNELRVVMDPVCYPMRAQGAPCGADLLNLIERFREKGADRFDFGGGGGGQPEPPDNDQTPMDGGGGGGVTGCSRIKPKPIIKRGLKPTRLPQEAPLECSDCKGGFGDWINVLGTCP
jgi:hypothetical protein